MATLQEMNEWVQDALGVDPESFAAAGTSSRGKTEPKPGAKAAPEAAAAERQAAEAAKPTAQDDEQLKNTEKDARNLVDAILDFAKTFTGKNGSIATLTHTMLTGKMADAAKLADVNKRVTAYIAISKAAKEFYAKCNSALKMWTALDKPTESVFIRGNAVNTASSNADLAKVNAAFAALRTDPVTIADVIVGLGKIKKLLDALSVKFDAEKAVASDAGDLKKDLDERMASLQTALGSLADDKAKKPLTDQVAKLAARTKAAEAETGDKAKKDLFTAGKAALVLLEKIEKLAFAQEVAKPGGAEKLDKMIAGFGDNTDDPVKQATCKAAIGARFNLDVEVPDGLSVKRLPQLYAIMASVPPEDVNQDKFKKLEYRSPNRGDASYYNPTDSEIVLQSIPEDDRDQNYVRQDGSNAKETVKYFNATTLHEIGHGVDEKFKVMETHQGSAGYGKWKKSSMDEAVGAFYAAFFAKYALGGGATEDDLKLLVRTLIDKGGCAKPQEGQPMASLLNSWDAISTEKAFVSDCWAIRMVNDPWKTPIDVGGTVYIESYPGVWWQYELAERKKGISDYQWRAPHEWFAEVYALWHLKKVEGFPAAIAEIVKGKPKKAA